MYNNPYAPVYNPQASVDRINSQIAELEKIKSQIPQTPVQQPTNLTQNFQIASNNSAAMRYADSIEEVQKDLIIGDTPFFSKDLSVVWIKSTNGDIKAYELNEIVQKDEKDLKIEFLEAQLEELKGMINNESNVTDVTTTENESTSTGDDDTTGATTKKK